MKSILIDISGVFEQEGFTNLPAIDLKGLEGTNCYCSPEAAEVISARLADVALSTVCWIDTGDYHYISYFRGMQIQEPFELVLLDNHTDDFDLSEALSCGNWVTALRRANNCAVTHCDSFRACSEIGDKDIPVFLSIDLDVLAPSEFRTNWDQGSMTFAELLAAVRDLASRRRILAVDICGGITESKGALSCDLSTNLRQRLLLMDLLNTL